MTLLLDLSHTRARALLASGAPVYLPVNPVEYHGPHLSLHNDALVSAGLAQGIHARLQAGGSDWPLLMGADLEVGVDPTPGPGTRVTSYREASALVVEACKKLVELGARRVVLMTFHGSPLHSLAIHAGVRWLQKQGIPTLSPLNLILRALLDINPADYADAYATIDDPTERAAMMRDGATDFHAGFFETSVSLHYAPDSVDPLHKQLPPCPPIARDPKLLAASRMAARFGRHELARELAFAAAGLGWHALRPFPGYTSAPHHASREAGAIIARYMETELANVASRVLRGEEPAPEPIMQWMAPATFGGSVPTTNIPPEAVATFEPSSVL